jgi:hypothetical protein
MHGILQTGGERVELDCRCRWLADVLEEGAAGELRPASPGPVDVRVTVEDTAAAFDASGWEPLTRGAWRRPGQVIVRDACSSGLDLLVRAIDDTLDVRARWRPSAAVRGANALLRSRARLLLREVLLQYPAIWWAGRRGRAPLHASVCTLPQDHAAPTALIAGPGGVGKSTLVQAELAAGGSSTCDNLCTSDGHRAWGMVEPLRVEIDRRVASAPVGRRMPHGRRETQWPSRIAALTPDVLIVLRRGTDEMPVVRPLDPDQASRVLVTGTYMAGELRRYWQFAATLALGTGVGRAHPAVEEVAGALAAQLPCLEVVLGRAPGERLGVLLDATASRGTR